MTPEETTRVLAKCAAFDRRTVGRADVLAWHEALDDVPLDVALIAVTRWYRAHRDWVMPSDVRALADEVDRERRRDARIAAAAATMESRPEVTQGPMADNVRAFIAEVRAALPPGDPDKLRRAEWLELERTNARAVRAEAEPNPDFVAFPRLDGAA